jgi:hypothetical protein
VEKIGLTLLEAPLEAWQTPPNHTHTSSNGGGHRPYKPPTSNNYPPFAPCIMKAMTACQQGRVKNQKNQILKFYFDLFSKICIHDARTHAWRHRETKKL